MNKKLSLIITFLAIFALALPFISATTLKGSIYNSNLNLENDVLIEINTTPQQQYLAKDGTYQFELPIGEYLLTAQKGEFEVVESIKIVDEGSFILDVFLINGLSEEDELWQESEEDLFNEEENVDNQEQQLWRKVLFGTIVILLTWRLVYMRKKYGSLKKFRKKIKVEQKKTVEEHKAELEQEPGYIDKAIEIIKKHDGRISQKELRKEMLYLSEAKVSLIVTELEHKGKVEKVRKGRGNVIILK